MTLNGSGIATCTVTYASTAGSPHSITAPYSGDTNYNTAAGNTVSETVNAVRRDRLGECDAEQRHVSCDYTSITAVTCTASGVGSKGAFTANVRLIDNAHNAVTNTTGGSISVSQTTSGCRDPRRLRVRSQSPTEHRLPCLPTR